MAAVVSVTHEDPLLDRMLVALYAAELDLHALPQAIFDCVSTASDAELVSYGEFHLASGDFRCLFSQPDPDPERRASTLEAYARLAPSHPFWLKDPTFYGERALRESDFFTDEEYLALPIAIEVFLPANAHRAMGVVIALDGYLLSISSHRQYGQPPFSDAERDRMTTLRGHVARLYQQALERTAASLSPIDRLGYLCPELTPRQREVAVWLAAGNSNEAIARLLHISADTVKSHIRVIFQKLGVEDRLAAGLAVHRRPLFTQLPPLWNFPGPRWGPTGLERMALP